MFAKHMSIQSSSAHIFVTLFLFSSLISNLEASAQVAGEQGDAPLFESRLSEEAFEAELAKHWPEVEKALARPSTGPMRANGLWVGSVTENSQASRIGLKPGDTVTHYQGVEVFDKSGFSYQRQAAPRGTMTWLDERGNTHEAEVREGPIGFGHYKHTNVLGWYVRSDQRDKRWDREMFLALNLLDHCVDGVPLDLKAIDLAEAALARAVATGFSDETLLHSLAAELARARLDYATAWHHLQRLPMSGGENNHLMTPKRRIEVARATYQIDYIASLLDKHGPQYPSSSVMNHNAWLTAAQLNTDLPSPLELAADAKRERLNSELEHEPTLGRVNNPRLAQQFIEEETANYSLEPATYNAAGLYPPQGIEDFEMTVRFRVKPNLPNDKTFLDSLWVGVYRRSFLARGSDLWTKQYSVMCFQTTFYNDGGSETSVAGFPFDSQRQMFNRFFDVTGESKQELRIIRVGGRAQIIFEDKILLDSYVIPDFKDLTFVVHTVGLDVRELEVTLDKIIIDK